MIEEHTPLSDTSLHPPATGTFPHSCVFQLLAPVQPSSSHKHPQTVCPSQINIYKGCCWGRHCSSGLRPWPWVCPSGSGLSVVVPPVFLFCRACPLNDGASGSRGQRSVSSGAGAMGVAQVKTCLMLTTAPRGAYLQKLRGLACRHSAWALRRGRPASVRRQTRMESSRWPE